MKTKTPEMVRICGLLCTLGLASATAFAQAGVGDRAAEPNDLFGHALARGDFNGDGYMDLAIGVPGEGIAGPSGQIQSAGAVEVIYGSQGGLDPNQRQFWSQGTASGIPDGAGADFGLVLAAGDFNHDGYTDLAIGAPVETVNGLGAAGAVVILYGSPKGLTAGGSFVHFWSQASPGIQGGPGAGNNFGLALAAGDFNHDGFADLAIGVPNETFCSASCQLTGRGLLSQAGAVVVIYGSAVGLSTTPVPSQFWSETSSGIQGGAASFDGFGSTLTAGDFNGDGYADLAIGVPDKTVATLQYAGAVNVIYGSVTGLNATAVANQFWTQNSSGMVDRAKSYDLFGYALAVGDFNGDGIADLAVGAARESIGLMQDAGVVNVIYGSHTGLNATTVPNQVWDLNSAGVPGTAQAGDMFGDELTVGDFNGDRFSDLAICVRHATVGTATDAGAVSVIYGSSHGLNATTVHSQLWSQDGPSVLDQAESGDFFGKGLAAGDFNGDGRDDLAVGVPDESLDAAGGTITDAGAVNVIYGFSQGLNSTAIPNQFFTQIYTLPLQLP